MRNDEIVALKLQCNIFSEEYTSQKSKDTGDESDRFEGEILNYLKQTKMFSKEASEKIQAIIETQDGFESQVELAESTIVKGRRELIEIIDKYTETLLHELILIRQEWFKKFHNEKEDMESHKRNIQRLESNMNEMLSDVSKERNLDMNDMRSENEALHASHIRLIQRHIHTIQVSFEASHLEDFLKAENCVGALKGIALITCKSRHTLRHILREIDSRIETKLFSFFVKTVLLVCLQWMVLLLLFQYFQCYICGNSSFEYDRNLVNYNYYCNSLVNI